MTMIPALIGFAFVTSITPGPNNMMLMASGANFGMRRSLPHLLGVSLGFGLMVALLGLGVERLFQRAPSLGQAMAVLSVVYILWLAWRIAHAAAPEGGTRAGRPLGFLAACAFQWVNPKAWAMALGALTAYAPGVGGAWVVALVFVLINLPSVAVWVGLGQGVRRLLQTPWRLRLFNLMMAGLLVASMLPVVAGLAFGAGRGPAP
ncbi:LysE family translocator [Paracoccus sp. p4-l81]|uniref:LysE family translocator n=1 Tax=unclassified Paracoccus (in: a-proteobacteria) TaxID=2688777 RepID=UPI0035B7EA88